MRVWCAWCECFVFCMWRRGRRERKERSINAKLYFPYQAPALVLLIYLPPWSPPTRFTLIFIIIKHHLSQFLLVSRSEGGATINKVSSSITLLSSIFVCSVCISQRRLLLSHSATTTRPECLFVFLRDGFAISSFLLSHFRCSLIPSPVDSLQLMAVISQPPASLPGACPSLRVLCVLWIPGCFQIRKDSPCCHTQIYCNHAITGFVSCGDSTWLRREGGKETEREALTSSCCQRSTLLGRAREVIGRDVKWNGERDIFMELRGRKRGRKIRSFIYWK